MARDDRTVRTGLSYDPPVLNRGRLLRILTLGLLIAAVGYLLWRGIWRGAADSSDLAVGFSAARAWLLGHNPYDAAVLNNDFLRAGGAGVAEGGLDPRLLNVFFPATVPIYVPLALVPWPAARALGLLINLGGTLFIAYGVIRLLGWRLASPRALVLAASIFVLGPVEDTIVQGQISIVAVAVVVAAMLLERSGRAVASGVMYGLATAIKVQIGLPFVAYLLWRRRWAPALASCLVPVALTALSVARMQVAAVPWSSSWLDNLSWLSRPGGLNDPSTQNPSRFYLIDLPYLLHSFVSDGALVQLVTLGAVGAAALAFMWLRRGRDAHPDLLALAVVTVLGLLVGYHRGYDAVLLVIPITWACSVIGTPRWGQAVVVLVLCADFLLGFQVLASGLQDTRALPNWLTDGVFWRSVVLTQHVWALVLMAIVLLAAAAGDRQRGSRDELEDSQSVSPIPSGPGSTP